MSAIWPSIAEGFLTARLRVTYYTMKNCRLSDSLIAATKRNVIPATKSFYKYLKIFFCNTLYLENVQLRVSLSAIERQTANILTSRTGLCAI